jgi:hypothetical protein
MTLSSVVPLYAGIPLGGDGSYWRERSQYEAYEPSQLSGQRPWIVLDLVRSCNFGGGEVETLTSCSWEGSGPGAQSRCTCPRT